jgi:tRNA (guanine-N7-)-methyltransferase
LVVQTDNPAYWRYMAAVVPRFFDFHQQKGPWPDAPAGRTRREIMARRKGLPVFRGFGHPRPELDAAALDSLVAELPAPDFDTEKASAARRRPHRRNKP